MIKLKRFRRLERPLIRTAQKITQFVKRKAVKVRQRLSVTWTSPAILRLRRAAGTPVFAGVYAGIAVTILFGTTLLWGVIGARLHMENSDQLINPYLFETPATFKDAMIPGSHSFLLKWPLFMLIKHLGFTPQAYITITLAVVMLTVAAFAFILYRIERRPLVFGTICLALASVLLLVPTVPYPGALLPVNMAMLATRNIEYIVFIASLILLTRARSVRSIGFWAAIGLLSVLVASDKLFLALTIGGATLALMTYGLTKGWNLVSTASRWILAGLLSAVGSTAFVWLLTSKSITHITNQGGAGPYGLIGNAHELLLGITYGALHLLTNFGANPSTQTTILRDVPDHAWQGLRSIAGFSFLVNFLVLVFGLYAACMIIRHSLAHNKDSSVWLNRPSKLSIALVWSSAAAFVLFIVSKHYYAGDARYLALALFGLFVAGTTFAGQKNIRPRLLAIIAPILLVSICLSLPQVLRTYHSDQAVLAPLHVRNDRINAALKQHAVKVLVGDYWRVIPIKFTSSKPTKVLPLENCTVPRSTLSSKAWQPDLTKNSFAYLLSLDAGLSDYPHCSLDTIIAAYGRPNASIVITGSIASPKEMLLFYDNGAGRSAPIHKLSTPSTVLPVGLEDLPNPICKGPTLMNVVAHEDDDLLFMNPDLDASIKSGMCVRTVYVTAGDAGSGAFYWLGRERGSQAAYSKMLGWNDIWVQRIVRLADGMYATFANPRGNTKITLIYLHLPDGNLKGQGFSSRQHESLAALENGTVSAIHDVYDGAAYSALQLQATLSDIMLLYQPTEIRTQANVASNVFPDHSDHMAVGRYTTKARQVYVQQHFAGKVNIPINYYVGYPIHQRPINIFGEALENKEQIFQAYVAFDGGVCHTVSRCRRDSAYGAYLSRQYQSPN